MNKNNNFYQGLVIKEESNGEKAKLIHVLTPDGILLMKAPGAKNLKSSTHSAVQLFTLSEFSAVKGKGYYMTITGAVAKNNFFGLRNNVLSYALACYISSVAGKVSVNDSTCGDILRLVLNCFYALSDLNYSTDIVKPIFEIKLASVCGFSPELSVCPNCEKSTDGDVFDFFTSGIICKECEKNYGISIKSNRFYKLDSFSVSILNYVSTCEMKKIFKVKPVLENPDNHIKAASLRVFSERFICHMLEYEPKTLSFYNQLIRSIKK